MTTTVGIVAGSLGAAIALTVARMALLPTQRRALGTVLFLEIVVLIALVVRAGGHNGAPLLLIPAIAAFAWFFGRRSR